VDDATRAIAARLAHDAQLLSPDDLGVQTVALATAWEAAVYRSALDKPLDFEHDPTLHAALAVNPKLAESVVSYGLRTNHYAAVRVAADVLGRTGSSIQPLLGDSLPSPLVLAVRAPDRRLRLAAIEAITRLAPKTSFSGSGYVTDALEYFVATTGFRRALLVTPNDETLQDWMSILGAMRFQSDIAHNGREALKMSFRCPDYELVLIDPAVSGPMADSIVQQLRQDYRTANLRVGIVARNDFTEYAQQIAASNPLTLAFSRPHDAQAARWQYRQLSELTPREFVGFKERQAQAARALDCLATLAHSSKVFETGRLDAAVATGMYAPGLGGHVAAVLVSLGTPASQQQLVELGSHYTEPLAVRSAAVKAFRLSVARFGLLLNEEAIRRQYERYDRSASLDAASQELFASILDTIESQMGVTKSIALAKKAAHSSKGDKPKAAPAAPVAPAAKPHTVE
jgi:CheY-like chemotaxis protein